MTSYAFAQPVVSIPREVIQALRAAEDSLAGRCLTTNGCGAKQRATGCVREYAPDGRSGVTFCMPDLFGEPGRGTLFVCYDLPKPQAGGCKCHERKDAC
jgi:hypothetical protein